MDIFKRLTDNFILNFDDYIDCEDCSAEDKIKSLKVIMKHFKEELIYNDIFLNSYCEHKYVDHNFGKPDYCYDCEQEI